MSEHHMHTGGLARQHRVPCEMTFRRDICLGLELHLSGRRDEAQARQGVDDYAGAIMTGKAVVPGVRLAAAHHREEAVILPDCHFRLARQRKHLGHVPLRQHASMHQKRVVLEMGQLA